MHVMNVRVVNYVAGSIYIGSQTVTFPTMDSCGLSRERVINFIADLIARDCDNGAITILIGYNNTISDYVVKRL